MEGVGAAKGGDIIGIRAFVYPLKVLDRHILVTKKLGPTDMDDCVARMTYGNDVLKALDGLINIVRPSFMGLQTGDLSATDHTAPFCAGVGVTADDVPHFRL